MPTFLCDKYVHNMNFCRWPVARLPKCRPTVVRLSADGLPMPNKGFPMSDQLYIFLMWMRVVARF